MKNKTLFIFTLILGLALASTSWGTLYEIMKTYRSVRSLGMGGVSFTTGIYDESLFSNPAMAAYDPESRIEILSPTVEANTNILNHFHDITTIKGASGADAISKIATDQLAGNNMHARFTGLFGWYSPKLIDDDTGFSFGLVTNLQANVMLQGDAGIDVQAFEDVGPGINLSHKMMDGNLAIGVNARALYRLAAAQSIQATSFLTGTKLSLNSLGGQGLGLDGDLGGIYRWMDFGRFFKNLWFAASLNNVTQSTYRQAFTNLIKSITSAPPRDNRTLNLGVRTDLPDAWFLTQSLFAIEVQDIGSLIYTSSFWKRLHFGGETHITKRLSFRGGVNEGYLTGGVGIKLPLLDFEVATYGEELGTNTGQLEDRRVIARIGIEI